jgi:hypothetical protein
MAGANPGRRVGWARWEHFWFQGIPPHAYAALRIALGLVGTLTLIGLRDLDMFWDPRGLVPAEGLIAVKTWVLAHGLERWAAGSLYAICLGAFVAMTVGYRSAFAVPFAFVCLLVQLSWNSLPLSGAHQAMQGFLFCLAWAECGAVWSVDAWLARRRTPNQRIEPASIAPLRLVRYQVALIYLGSGLWKLFDPLWRDGSAVHYVLNSNVFHRFPAASWPEWMTMSATYATLTWELAFAVLILHPATRVVALLAGVLLHLGMLVLIEIGPFHFVMLASYMAFIDPHVVARLGTFGATPAAERELPHTVATPPLENHVS